MPLARLVLGVRMQPFMSLDNLLYSLSCKQRWQAGLVQPFASVAESSQVRGLQSAAQLAGPDAARCCTVELNTPYLICKGRLGARHQTQ
jgi:hypothetical protein